MVQIPNRSLPTDGTFTSRSGMSPIGTSSPNTGSTAATNSTYGKGAFASGINIQGAATVYTVQNTDYQGIIEFNGAAAITITLNQAVGTNFATTILNLGTGAITLTPNGSLLVNGAASVTLQSGVGVQVFFANRQWTAFAGATSFPIVPVTTAAVPHEWFDAYDATTGIFTATQPAFSDVSGTATTAQIGTGTPAAGKYVDGGTGAWTALPGAGTTNFSDGEVPTGLINSINVTYTLLHSPSPAMSLILSRAGLVQQQGGGDDYTLAGSTITFTVAPTAGPLLAWYRY